MLQLLSSFASTLQAMTVFQRGFVCVLLTQGPRLRALAWKLD
jgi:hypothetical protein